MAAYDKEFIVRYAEDDLSEDERRQFEADLQTDPSLAEELSLYRELKAALQERLPADEGAAALRSTLKELNRQHFSTAKHIPMTRWLTGVAAAIIIAFSIYVLIPSSSLESLGRTEMISTTERGSNTDTLLQQAAVYFNQQEFTKALPLLDKAVQADSTSQLALFYRGVTQWHTGANEAARKDLTQVYNGESLLRFEAAFYIALSYASEKKNPEALEWLQKIPAGTPVSDRAQKLKNKLK